MVQEKRENNRRPSLKAGPEENKEDRETEEGQNKERRHVENDKRWTRGIRSTRKGEGTSSKMARGTAGETQGGPTGGD